MKFPRAAHAATVAKINEGPDLITTLDQDRGCAKKFGMMISDNFLTPMLKPANPTPIGIYLLYRS
jgi:hypothetical protein